MLFCFFYSGGNHGSHFSSTAFASEPWFMILLGSISIMFIVLVLVGIIAYRRNCWSPLHKKQTSLNSNHGGGADMVVGLNGMSYPINRTGITAEYDQMTQR